MQSRYFSNSIFFICRLLFNLFYWYDLFKLFLGIPPKLHYLSNVANSFTESVIASLSLNTIGLLIWLILGRNSTRIFRGSRSRIDRSSSCCFVIVVVYQLKIPWKSSQLSIASINLILFSFLNCANLRCEQVSWFQSINNLAWCQYII